MSNKYRTRYAVSHPAEEDREKLEQALSNADEALDRFLTDMHTQADVHRVIIDPDSFRKISAVAYVDIAEHLNELRDNPWQGAAAEADKMTATLSGLRQGGVDYTPIDPENRDLMGFHNSYRSDRLAEAYAAALGLNSLPTLESLEQEPRNIIALTQFTNHLPQADTTRLLTNMVTHYANEAPPEDFVQEAAVVAKRLNQAISQASQSMAVA